VTLQGRPPRLGFLLGSTGFVCYLYRQSRTLSSAGEALRLASRRTCGHTYPLQERFVLRPVLTADVFGELVKTHTAVRNQGGGQLRLVNLNKRVDDLLQMTRLSAVFDIERDEASAIKSQGYVNLHTVA